MFRHFNILLCHIFSAITYNVLNNISLSNL